MDVLDPSVEGYPQIPKDCEIWTNGCVDCEVKNGQIVKCPRQTCKFTKCQPYCKKFTTPAKPNENCVSWFDGCNRCFFLSKEVLYQSSKTGDTFSLPPRARSDQAACTRMMCFETKEPKCMKERDCRVSRDEMKLLKGEVKGRPYFGQ